MSRDRAWGEAVLVFRGDDVDSGLTADELAQLRHRLLGRLDELVDRIAAIGAIRRRPGGTTADTVDPVLGDRVAAHERDLEATTEALAALEAGVYGICLGCRRPIGFATLGADPTGVSCLACAALGGSSERHPATGRGQVVR